VGTNGDDFLSGTIGPDSLFGLGRDDALEGFEGADVLDGGSLNEIFGDTAVYNDSDAGVTIFLFDGLGFDGDAEGDVLIDIENITGSRFDDAIIGDNEDNAFESLDGNDGLIGAGGDDSLEGGAGADALDGGDGTDRLDGGADGDQLAGGAGIDVVEYFRSDAGVFVDLAANVGRFGDAEGDTFFGIENVDGTSAFDTLLGDGLRNELFGGGANDTIDGRGGNDRLLGDLGDDLMRGGDGNDLLDGTDGADAMLGGAGNDLYFGAGSTDIIDEAAGGSGIDTVRSRESFSLASNRVKGDVENLTLTGSADLNGVGNALANTLTGNSGDNNINGNSGADLMRGMGGSDNYVVNETGDVVDESVAGSGGEDSILSFVSISLSGPKVLGSVENVRLALGTSPLVAAGNALANELVGNNGNNDLMGLQGNDELTGFGGKDTFVFNAALNAVTNVDIIHDFRVEDDTIRLENGFMPGLGTGPLAAAAFRIGPTAADATDRIIYDDDTGGLFFDRDGVGGAAQVRFATLDADLAMSNADFLVV
jgi:Ca2+-binding RTX toxin-like protein